MEPYSPKLSKAAIIPQNHINKNITSPSTLNLLIIYFYYY